MFREIKKKQIILAGRLPYAAEVRAYIDELNTLDFVYGSLRLDGSALSRAEAERILKGEFIREASLNEHSLIDKYRHLFQECKAMLDMSCSFNKDMLFGFSKLLTGEPRALYRKENPVLVSFGYNPPHPSEIEEQLDLMMNWFYSDDMDLSPIRKAVCLHHKLIEIYPFTMYSEVVARTAMYYFLMEQGYPMFEINMSEQEYNRSVMEYLRNENAELFYGAVERSLFNKMEVLIQLTAR